MDTIRIHPTAIIETGATWEENIEIGAYAYIGPEVHLGSGTKIHHHATVEGNTRMGKENEVFPYALVGGRTQDKKWNGESGPIHIGDRNIFREFTTVHPSTFLTGETRIGSDNLFCAYAHIGHESHVGDHCVFSNNATLGGHCKIGSRVVIGGLTAVHQFCRVGNGAMLGGCARVTQDVLPYMIAEGHPAEHRAYNKVGLERAGYTPEQVLLIRKLFKHVFRSGLNTGQAMQELRSGALGEDPLIEEIIHFHSESERGLA